MTANQPAGTARIVIAGGGVAALEAVLALRELAPATEVEVVASEPAFTYTPLSVLEPFSAGRARTLPLARLADLGATVRRARVARVDPDARVLHTADGESVPYDALVVALGARPRRAFEHALTFRGPVDAEAMHGLVQDIEGGWTRSVAFVVPEGVTWSLPLYELVLETADRARDLCLGVRLVVVTPEERPLEVFGRAGSALAESLLAEHGVQVVCGASPRVPRTGVVVAGPDGAEHHVDRVVALPHVHGHDLPVLPANAAGFLPVDAGSRVLGVPGVYAAGDGTDHALKQGGLATQEAERAVHALLADLGLAAPVPLEPFVLRGMLITGPEAWYLRRRVEGDDDGEAARRPLWWPPNKVAGKRLAPFLDHEAGSRPALDVERRFAARPGVKRRAVIAPQRLPLDR